MTSWAYAWPLFASPQVARPHPHSPASRKQEGESFLDHNSSARLCFHQWEKDLCPKVARVNTYEQIGIFLIFLLRCVQLLGIHIGRTEDLL